MSGTKIFWCNGEAIAVGLIAESKIAVARRTLDVTTASAVNELPVNDLWKAIIEQSQLDAIANLTFAG